MLLELEQRAEAEPVPVQELKLRRRDRKQVTYAALDVEALIAPQHPARAIWEFTDWLELGAFAGLQCRPLDSAGLEQMCVRERTADGRRGLGRRAPPPKNPILGPGQAPE